MSDVKISFEFFPTRNSAMEIRLSQTVDVLKKFSPTFISVTCQTPGAGAAYNTLKTIDRLKIQTEAIPLAAHLTILSGSKEEILQLAAKYRDAGIKHLIAVRGDPPGGVNRDFAPLPDGYQDSPALIEAVKSVYPFEVTVAAYPEKHPAGKNFAEDLEMLRRKIDAGATCAITQCFFDNEIFERYLEKIAKAGLKIEIVPGLLPIFNFTQIQPFMKKIGVDVSPAMHKRFTDNEASHYEKQLLEVSVLWSQLQHLKKHQLASHVHFYTLNRHEVPAKVCELLRNSECEDIFDKL